MVKSDSEQGKNTPATINASGNIKQIVERTLREITLEQPTRARESSLSPSSRVYEEMSAR